MKRVLSIGLVAIGILAVAAGWWSAAVAGSVALARRDRILGLYCLVSLALLPLQGELVNAFRFTAVLFPLHLWAGERLAAAPVGLRALAIASWLGVNVWVTRELAYGKWAY